MTYRANEERLTPKDRAYDVEDPVVEDPIFADVRI